MSPGDLIGLAIFLYVITRILKKVVSQDVVKQGRQTLGDLAESMRDGSMMKTPPGPRGTPRPGYPSVRPGNRRNPSTRSNTITTRSASTATQARGALRPAASLDDWHLVLDVSPDATRREVQEALKLRLARARAARDSEAVRRVMRAAAIGIAQPRGRND